jgi:hypothetical protein
MEPDNHSRVLYEKLGFKQVGDDGSSLTMLLKLN